MSGLARDLGLKRTTVQCWKARGSVPGVHWKALADIALVSDVPGVTLETLARAAEIEATKEKVKP